MINMNLPRSLLAGLAGSLLLFAVAAEAHPRHSGDKHGRLAAQLELTEEQQQALRDAHAAHRQALQAARASGAREAMRAHGRSMREVYAEVLTTAQLETLRDLRTERHEARTAQRDARFERLMAPLELHSSQVEPVREILSESHRAVRSRMWELAAEAEGQRVDRSVVRAERERVLTETRERLSAVLTPAQLELYDAQRAEMQRGYRYRNQG